MARSATPLPSGWLAYERGGAGDTQMADFRLEVVCNGIGAMVLSQRQPFGDAGADAAKMLRDALPVGLKRPPATGAGRGMDAHELAGTMVDRNEHKGPALAGGHRLGRVDAPDLIFPPIGHDGVIVQPFGASGLSGILCSRAIR